MKLYPMLGLVKIEGDILKKIYPFNKIKKIAINKNSFRSFLIMIFNIIEFNVKYF